jgi:hypothetical protein
LHDSPPKSTAEEDSEMSKLLPAQKKKLKQKQRKAEARAKKVLIISVAAFYATSCCRSIHDFDLFPF